MDINVKDKILYALVGLQKENCCSILCDTAFKTDFTFKMQYLVVSILADMKKIEFNKIRVKKEG